MTTKYSGAGDTIRLTQLLGDLRILVILFISFRLMLMMIYQPMLIDNVERGLGAQGDRLYHWQLASLTEDGQYPFSDWWSEFPPVWYFMTTTVYQLQGEGVNYSGWSMAMGMIVLLFDVGNLLLMRAIGTQL